MDRDLFGDPVPPDPPPNPTGKVWWECLSNLLGELEEMRDTPPNTERERRDRRRCINDARRACAAARAAAGLESERHSILPELSKIDRVLQKVTAQMLAGGPHLLPPGTSDGEKLRSVLPKLWAIAGTLTSEVIAREIEAAAQIPRSDRTCPVGYGDAQSLTQDLRGLGVCATAKSVYQYLRRNEKKIELAFGSTSWRICSTNKEKSPGGRAKRGRSEAEWTFSRAVVLPRLIEHFG